MDELLAPELLAEGSVSIVRRPLGRMFEVAAWEDAAKPAGTHVLPLGPRRWLVASEIEPAATGCSVADVSGAWHCLAISGPDARAVLAAEITLDLAPPAFPEGSIAMTRVADTRAILVAEPADTFALYLPASLKEPIECLLLDVAASLGATVAQRGHRALVPRRASPAEQGLR